jgi:hypothetical protein
LFLQLQEVLEMLVSYLESKSCKDQVFLVLYEPHCAETLYCLLVERNFSMELKQKVLKVILLLTRLSFKLVPEEPVCHTSCRTADISIVDQGVDKLYS